MGWKTKMLLTWLAVEIALLPIAIPATAQIVERIALSFPARVTAVELGKAPGVSQYIVVSNAPFSIIAEGAIGEIDVDIKVSGQVNKIHFGQKAQKPGPLHSCANLVNSLPNIVYTAERKTAAKRGKVLEQSIIVELQYDEQSEPIISFEPVSGDIAVVTPAAQSCKVKNS